MERHATTRAPANPASYYANVLGFYASILTAALTAVTFAIAFLTPPISGSSCTKDCIDYPYLDIVARVPRDYLWMVPAMVLTFVYFVLMVCIHHYASEDKKVFSQIGLSVALAAAAILIVDYFVQVSVIQPSLENGETDGIALLTQYNPHGLFIALEDIGYLLMAVSFLFAAPVFSGRGGVERAIRWIFITAFLLALLALIVITALYGTGRGYRFEVAVISIDWLVLIVGGALLSIVFRRALRTTPP